MVLFIRHGEARRLEAEITELRERIVQPRIPVILPVADVSNDPVDWQNVARNWPAFGNDHGIWSAHVRMRHKLQQVPAEKLAAAVEDLAATELSAYDRERFGGMLFAPLAQLDPELALKKGIHAIRDTNGAVHHGLSRALESWARIDPNAASAWFDRELAAGTFMDRKLRQEYPEIFEMRLINALIDVDPAAARKRMAQVPESNRDQCLSFLFDNTRSHVACATFARDMMPEGNHRDLKIARPARAIVIQKGYEGVEQYMREINASSSERREISKAALRAIEIRSAEDVRVMRHWAAQQELQESDTILGSLLSHSVPRRPGLHGIPFEQAGEIAKNTGSESLLVAFLQGQAGHNHPEQAGQLAEHISDPALRDRVLNFLK